MSQAGITNTSSGPVPPTVATQYTENTGIAVPAANNLNVIGGVSVVTTGSGSTITIDVRNFIAGTATTIGNVTSDAITLALGATPATYSIDVRISAFSNTDEVGTPIAAAGSGYNLFATVRTDGTNAFLVGTPDKIINEDVALITSDVNVVVDLSNNAIVRVLGISGRTIRWRAVGLYTSVS